MLSRVRGLRWAAAAIAGVAAAALPAVTAGADGAPAPGVTVNVNQNATGVNVCAAGATCTQRVNVLNVSVVIVVQGATPAPAHVTLAPASIDFGQVIAGHGTRSRTAALTNRGGLPAVITGIAIFGGSPAFSVGPGSCGPTGAAGVLLPGHGCALGLLFKPSTLGVQRAVLHVDVDAATLTTGLLGSGIVAPPPPPRAPIPAPPQDNSLPLPVNLAGAAPNAAGVTTAAAFASRASEPVRHPMTTNLGRFNDNGEPAHGSAYELDRVTATSMRGRTSQVPASGGGVSLAPLRVIVWLSLPLLAALVTMAIGRMAHIGRRRRIGLVWLD